MPAPDPASIVWHSIVHPTVARRHNRIIVAAVALNVGAAIVNLFAWVL